MPAKKDPIVYELSRSSRCHNCDTSLAIGDIVKLKDNDEEREVLCKRCAKLDDLEKLPSGNAVLTRLASKHSAVRFVVMRWSELWKCYERQGVLVERSALERAKAELESSPSPAAKE